MSFWDNVKKFTQPYADDEYDDDYDEEQDDYGDENDEPAPRPARRAPAFSQPASQTESTPDYSAPPTVSTASASPITGSSGASSLGGFSGQVLNMSASGNKQEVVLFHAKAFDDAARAADDLRSRKAIILNMENVDKALTRRVVDFLSGCVYALDGKVKKIAQSTYLFCPHSMDIIGDLENFQGEVESYI